MFDLLGRVITCKCSHPFRFMTRLTMTSLQIMGLQIDAVQFVEGILVISTRIFNFLARNDLQ